MPHRGLHLAAQRNRFVRALLRWGRANRRPFPWRSDPDPFRTLVTEVLLQRSRGRTVAKVHAELFRRWPRPQDLADAHIDEIGEVIRPLGLTRRAATLKALAAEIQAGGEVPETIEELQALPGVGPYAANATAALAFGRRVPTVDAVSARVYRRYFDLPDTLPPAADRDLWEAAAAAMPTRSVREWNWAVLDLAATICLPKRPRCEDCPLVRDCSYAARIHVGSRR